MSPETIPVAINGESRQVPLSLSMSDLLLHLSLDPRLLAVEYNGEILPRQLWSTTIIGAGDRLELVTIVGGG